MKFVQSFVLISAICILPSQSIYAQSLSIHDLEIMFDASYDKQLGVLLFKGFSPKKIKDPESSHASIYYKDTDGLKEMVQFRKDRKIQYFFDSPKLHAHFLDVLKNPDGDWETKQYGMTDAEGLVLYFSNKKNNHQITLETNAAHSESVYAISLFEKEQTKTRRRSIHGN